MGVNPAGAPAFSVPKPNARCLRTGFSCPSSAPIKPTSEPMISTRQQQVQESTLVHISQLKMCMPRSERCHHFRRVHTRARQRRWYAHTQQEAGAGYAIGHTQCAVHDLRREAHQDVNEWIFSMLLLLFSFSLYYFHTLLTTKISIIFQEFLPPFHTIIISGC